jgi:hypothetical protein
MNAWEFQANPDGRGAFKKCINAFSVIIKPYGILQAALE